MHITFVKNTSVLKTGDDPDPVEEKLERVPFFRHQSAVKELQIVVLGIV